MPSQGSEEDDSLFASLENANISLRVQRLQTASPPIGGTFQILLPNTVISGTKRVEMTFTWQAKVGADEVFLGNPSYKGEAGKLVPLAADNNSSSLTSSKNCGRKEKRKEHFDMMM